MGQIEVFDVLKTVRQAGDNSYFTPKEIETKIKNNSKYNSSLRTVRECLLSLHVYGYVETKRIDGWRRVFRIKKKYLKK